MTEGVGGMLVDIPVETIKKHLIVKKAKGNEYYYLRFRFGVGNVGFKDIEIYVCPVSCTDSELKNSFCLARTKSLVELLDFLYTFLKKHDSIKYLTEKEVKLLELLRLSYIALKQYNESDLKRYEDAHFTQYVHGTTSIEGNTYTLRETDLTLNEGVTIGGKPKREFYEIENYGTMKKYLDTLTKIEINIEFIKKIHSFILANIDDDSAGQFRKIDVGIRGTMFEPPPALFVEEKMDELMKWYKKNLNKMHPIELAAIFHQKFEEIHPFKDGNGRVGREIVRLILLENGYPTIFIDMQKREKYLKSLDAGNTGDYEPICRFIVTNLLEVHYKLLEKAQNDLKKIKEMCEKCTIKTECAEIMKKFSELVPENG